MNGDGDGPSQPLRRSDRKRRATEKAAPFEPSPSTKWTQKEKQRLLEGLTIQGAKTKCSYDWRALQKRVGTKPMDEVKVYVKRITQRAKQMKLDSNRSDKRQPIDEWLAAAEQLGSHSSNVLTRKCFAQLLTIAAAEPRQKLDVATPNYDTIYAYLGALLQGDAIPDIEPVESVVLLDLVQDLLSFLQSRCISTQCTLLRNAYRSATSQADKEEEGGSAAMPDEPSTAAESFQLFNPFKIPIRLLTPNQKQK
ncbi:uncharacterized protein [Oscarella lobularis]|uniref:uncharacterized protein n=1 Tax=Oscarella lobularis TaxID=121494 RepID=UPI00331405B1